MSAGCANTVLRAQQMTTQAPPASGSISAPKVDLPDDPEQVAYPSAQPVAPPESEDLVNLESSGPQTYKGGVYVLDKDVVITYKDRRVQADHIEYDSNTGDVTLSGHVLITSSATQERIAASHGTYNLKAETGRFYDVDGSYGIKSDPARHRTVYTTDSPFLFTGRTVVKTAPDNYDVYGGTVTTCTLPKPDWIFSSDHIALNDNVATMHGATFRLFNLPLLYFPYATHTADPNARQSGILIPTLSNSSSKGVVVGDQVYLVINRSADLTVGADYYSDVGWAQMATFRYKGPALDFLKLHYQGVLDQRIASLNQGGEEVVLAARHDISSETRAATNIDYLSSYVYREAFSDNYNQAVTSDILSTVYITHQFDGLEFGALADRYQGIKVVQTATRAQQEVHIFHAPTLSFDSTEHLVPDTGNKFSTGLEISLESSSSGLKRTQPTFETGGIVERFDVHPQANYPIAIDSWHIVPEVAVRETYYTRARASAVPGQPPEQSEDSTSRFDLEFNLAIRPPAIERTFHPTHLTKILGTELRHTIEPELTYRLADGVDNFRNILRFDDVDVMSNTDEFEYGMTQRIFRKPKPRDAAEAGKPCRTDVIAQSPGFTSDAPNGIDDTPMPETPDADTPTGGECPSEELISWRLTQKYFFDQTLGGAVANGRRNIFTTTLDLSGVAFLTEPRAISPLISRLRIRSSAHTDFEWDFDFDTGAKKFNSSNVYVDVHQGNIFSALSYARLDAPGRFYTENPTPTSGSASSNGVTTAISDFNQLRFLVGYGSPVKRGLSLAGNAGIDLKHLYGATSTTSNGETTTVYPALLQYATVQAAYNWNCCGLAFAYRKSELGAVLNDSTYGYSFTLANIASVGNLRRTLRLF